MLLYRTLPGVAHVEVSIISGTGDAVGTAVAVVAVVDIVIMQHFSQLGEVLIFYVLSFGVVYLA
jgi:hypothetical protein